MTSVSVPVPGGVAAKPGGRLGWPPLLLVVAETLAGGSQLAPVGILGDVEEHGLGKGTPPRRHEPPEGKRAIGGIGPDEDVHLSMSHLMSCSEGEDHTVALGDLV